MVAYTAAIPVTSRRTFRPRAFSVPDDGRDNACQSLENCAVIVPESCSFRRKHLENANNLATPPFYGTGDEGADPQRAATLAVHSGVGLCVITLESCCRTDTFARE